MVVAHERFTESVKSSEGKMDYVITLSLETFTKCFRYFQHQSILVRHVV